MTESSWLGFSSVLDQVGDAIPCLTQKEATAVALDLTDRWALNVMAMHILSRNFGSRCQTLFIAARRAGRFGIPGLTRQADGSLGPEWAHKVSTAAFDRLDYWIDHSSRFQNLNWNHGKEPRR